MNSKEYQKFKLEFESLFKKVIEEVYKEQVNEEYMNWELSKAWQNKIFTPIGYITNFLDPAHPMRFTWKGFSSRNRRWKSFIKYNIEKNAERYRGQSFCSGST